MLLTRRVGALVGNVAARRVGVRYHGGDAAKEMQTWKNYTVVAIGAVSIFGTYIGYLEYQHMVHGHDDHEKIPYSHMKIRHKPFPWKCPNCDLLDTKCWAECKANLAAKS